ncbi:MAG: response regulator [Deltaproteobacteria bacterium]|nr:response regulator [Deltaproteobacteria bacterium]
MARKILVIDDEPDMVTFLSTLLEDNGYEILTAVDGDEGLHKVKTERPDLVSLDLLMPNKTGIKMFRELRKDPDISNIPVVMVTGFATDDAPNMDFKKWINERSIRPPEAYIEKPVDTVNLLNEIKRILG